MKPVKNQKRQRFLVKDGQQIPIKLCYPIAKLSNLSDPGQQPEKPQELNQLELKRGNT